MAAVVRSQWTSPYHHGEIEAQTRIGVRESSARVGDFIRTCMNDQHKAFFGDLSFLHVGVRNPDGRVWATTLCGLPGFLNATDEKHLIVKLDQIYADPAKFQVGSAVGGVGVMLHNRRRNKLNGTVDAINPGSMSLTISQAIGNCPKYIQVRHMSLKPERLATLSRETRPVSRGGQILGEAEKAFIARSDTFFLATGYVGDKRGQQGPDSCDCNHKGGAPGFVKVVDDCILMIPDYIGNNMFQSIGNLATYPQAGVQFLDFDTGDSLQLTGHAEILYDCRKLPGAQRTIRFHIDQWVHVKGALPLEIEGPVEPSPYNPVPEGQSVMGLKCAGRHQETPDIVTFEFYIPLSGTKKAFCEAGQFASFDFVLDGKSLNRTWTISSCPQTTAKTGRFSISVKKAGLVSGWLHENMLLGREIQFRGVDGDFTLKAANSIPEPGVLLIAAGIGITPMRVMFAECIDRGYPVDLLYSFRTPEDAAFLDEFKQAAESRENVNVAVVLTGRGANQDLAGVPTFHGRLNADIIKQASPNCTAKEAFMCGPGPMMASTTQALQSLGVPATSIHQENFSF